jgi:hypothetical protein
MPSWLGNLAGQSKYSVSIFPLLLFMLFYFLNRAGRSFIHLTSPAPSLISVFSLRAPAVLVVEIFR